MTTVNDAIEIIRRYALSLGVERIPIQESFNRILAEDITADRNYPPFNRATMDGYALCFDDYENNKDIPFHIQGAIFAGDNADLSISEKSCVKIMTGASVPEGADLVIKVEDTENINDKVKFKKIQAKKWMNIALKGEDIKNGEVLITKGSRINHIVLSMLATVGKVNVPVFQTPKTAVISTGSEIIDPIEKPEPFQIRDSNSFALLGLLNEFGISPFFSARTDDKETEIRTTIEKALDTCDIIFISGGVSMGEKDLTPDILKSLGVKEIFHKVKIKPGKPVWFGLTQENKIVFGMPGNPFSCQVIFKILVEPLIRASFQMNPQKWFKFPMAAERTKKGDRDEYFTAGINTSNGSKITATANKGSGDIKAARDSDGLALHKADIPELKENDIVDFIFWRNA
ncbi:MAG: molybdopterin molybdotransferase MoeA [Spirochaetia bacterium]|nr:molybdopterin molybdotransferase MoeA [Spirochaetia bacterium]